MLLEAYESHNCDKLVSGRSWNIGSLQAGGTSAYKVLSYVLLSQAFTRTPGTRPTFGVSDTLVCHGVVHLIKVFAVEAQYLLQVCNWAVDIKTANSS